MKVLISKTLAVYAILLMNKKAQWQPALNVVFQVTRHVLATGQMIDGYQRMRMRYGAIIIFSKDFY